MFVNIDSNIINERLLTKFPSLQYVQAELRYTTQYLSFHKLTQSAKWSGELLLGITKQQDIDTNYLLKNYIQNNTDTNLQYNKIYIEKHDLSIDAVILAKNLFDLREFRKCAYVLQDYIKNAEYQSAIFLYYYSLYMLGEMQKDDELLENQDSFNKEIKNTELVLIERELEQFYLKNQLNDINLYLYAIVLKDLERKEEAKNLLIQVFNQLPCFWSAWLELARLLEKDQIRVILSQMHDHWMKNFIISSFCMEQYENLISIELNKGLLSFFKQSNFIMNQLAHGFYNSQDFEISLDFFNKLIDIDPFRFENMDTYSNILYIKEKQGELANLAMRCFQNNKYTPETCCAIGNYYSLMSDHIRAIYYFKKALKLDKNFLAAWTLMGHEYLELKNISGAIQAYRNAVDYDPTDFRAWYGLGQTYELQNMNNYALYYFTRAASSRPKDSRMWNALGTCFDRIDKKNESIKCFEKSESCKDKECIALFQLAKLYDLLGYDQKAVNCFEENLKRKDKDQLIDKEQGECLLYLTKYYKNKKDYEKAFEYARRLYDFSGPEREEANSILYEINVLNNK